ncbi:MAG: response regulator, partial [Rhodospirillaceae bacterium]|nr:response regulator [Rhodospirillaceae bacterium]
MIDNILKGLNILFVDDEVYTRQVFSKGLSSMGAPDVRTANNGADALELMRDSAFKIDVIICDFNMPIMHGLQLLKAIRCGTTALDRATPFALLTGYSDKRLVDLALALDVNAFLVKPASHKALHTRLGKLLSQTKSDQWLKEVDRYDAIKVDGALQDIVNPDVMPENSALFRRSRPRGGVKGVAVRGLPDKVIGVDVKGLHEDADTTLGVDVRGIPDDGEGATAGIETRTELDSEHDSWGSERRPQLDGRLCPIGELPEHSILARDVLTADGRL